MSRNMLVGLVVILAIGAGVLGYRLYEETRVKSGIEIKVGQDGVAVETR